MSYIFGLDVWEGSLNIDEAELKRGGVSFLIPRMNDINGALHLDQNFLTQWEQAAPFVRFPYYVYSPWGSGKINYEFMRAYLPKGVRRVAVDIEVKKDGYSPAAYASGVQEFMNLAGQGGLNVVIYTGGWFTSTLSQWPKSEYWWARYPYYLYPAQSIRLTWEELRRKLDILRWVPDCKLGTCRLWQCSGDRLKLPGMCERTTDLDVWSGTLEELRAWVDEDCAPIVTKTLPERVDGMERFLVDHFGYKP